MAGRFGPVTVSLGVAAWDARRHGDGAGLRAAADARLYAAKAGGRNRVVADRPRAPAGPGGLAPPEAGGRPRRPRRPTRGSSASVTSSMSRSSMTSCSRRTGRSARQRGPSSTSGRGPSSAVWSRFQASATSARVPTPPAIATHASEWTSSREAGEQGVGGALLGHPAVGAAPGRPGGHRDPHDVPAGGRRALRRRRHRPVVAAGAQGPPRAGDELAGAPGLGVLRRRPGAGGRCRRRRTRSAARRGSRGGPAVDHREQPAPHARQAHGGAEAARQVALAEGLRGGALGHGPRRPPAAARGWSRRRAPPGGGSPARW